MDIDSRPVYGVDDAVDGRWVYALFSVDGDEPTRAAVCTACYSNVPVERNAERGIGGILVEGAGDGFEGATVPVPLGNRRGEGAVFPDRVVGGGLNIRVVG